jgi:hypothetical protein
MSEATTQPTTEAPQSLTAAVTTTDKQPPKPDATVRKPMNVGEKGLILTTFDDMWRMSVAMSKSDLAPKDYRGKPENALIAIQYGSELGFKPMQALQSISVINGRPGIGGDAALALVRASGLLEDYFKEEIGVKGTDSYGFRVTVKRKGMSRPASEEYTVAKAKTAKLWGKQGPWSDHPDRMLFYRPLGYVLHDMFGDVLKGMVTTEELLDYPVDIAAPQNNRPKFDEEDLQPTTITTPVQSAATTQLQAEEASFKEVDQTAIDTNTGEIPNTDTRTQDEKVDNKAGQPSMFKTEEELDREFAEVGK